MSRHDFNDPYEALQAAVDALHRARLLISSELPDSPMPDELRGIQSYCEAVLVNAGKPTVAPDSAQPPAEALSLSCTAQNARYVDGEVRASYCGKPATKFTQSDAHIDHFCDDCAEQAIAAGARFVGLIKDGYPKL